jgi:hypothetical protein
MPPVGGSDLRCVRPGRKPASEHDDPRRRTRAHRPDHGPPTPATGLIPTLTRYIRRAGLDDPDLTGKSITVSRAYRILTTGDLKTAKRTFGEGKLYKGKLLVLDPHGNVVAKVKSKHVDNRDLDSARRREHSFKEERAARRTQALAQVRIGPTPR